MLGADDEEMLQLSAESIAALKEFLHDREIEEAKVKALEAEKEIEITYFKEDWQLSQFWYAKEFASNLGRLIIKHTTEGQSVALISCPSLYFHMKSTPFKAENESNLNLKLFEFDDRFERYSDFQFYDYNEPLDVPSKLKQSFDFICVDPPFLSNECWEKFAMTINYLKKPNAKILACTGLIMTKFINETMGLKPEPIEVRHSNGLSNEFGCFTNFKLE